MDKTIEYLKNRVVKKPNFDDIFEIEYNKQIMRCEDETGSDQENKQN